MNSKALQYTEYPEYFKTYLDLLDDIDLISSLNQSKDSFVDFLENLSLESYKISYAPGKWSIGEVIQHVIDCERVFQYRAFYIARDPGAVLPGFDHNQFAQNAKESLADPKQLIRHYDSVRQSTIQLFEGFTDKELLNLGNVVDQPASVRALGFIILGHQEHHLRIIKERYLK
jgi:uncharacterized damage-inducible protein DinB